jgi:hypothetical protein
MDQFRLLVSAKRLKVHAISILLYARSFPLDCMGAVEPEHFGQRAEARNGSHKFHGLPAAGTYGCYGQIAFHDELI